MPLIPQLRDEITNLQGEVDQLHVVLDRVLKESAEDKAENAQLRTTRLGPRLGPMHAASFTEDPKHLLFVLARYHFVARMISGAENVLEVGCGDGTGARLIVPGVSSLAGIDRDIQHDYPGVFHQGNILELAPYNFGVDWDAVFALDVLEHIDPSDEERLLCNMIGRLKPHGVCIIGTPSYESQPWASSNSRREHVNCKTETELRATLSPFFHNIFLFGMNDATLHTGFGPMCHYRLALCTGRRRI